MAVPVSPEAVSGADTLYTLATLPKTWRFTSALPADPKFATPAASHSTPRDAIQPRLVRGALFTWVRPEQQTNPELLAVSPAALRDLGLQASEAETEEFRQTAAGNKLWGWEGEESEDNRQYPWAQCYGGFQFGQWAGQLGDGRAISLFEAGGYEIQLKGAGITPYSRFADGRAVLRSSLREFVASEALHGLGIPTTRALALTLLPRTKVLRDGRLEPGAVVVRFAESWLRLGTFDLLRSRGDRELTRQLGKYVLEVLGETTDEINPFPHLFRAVVRRNAATVARWQVYGFLNGVLNTDNTSVCGLSMDFGPFAFLDHFDSTYTPNHDDHSGRYSYGNQPSVIWWNLVRFGEALGELMAAGDRVDHPAFVQDGILGLARLDVTDAADEAAVEKATDALVGRAESLIMDTADEYKTVFFSEYNRLFAARLGLPEPSAPSSSSSPPPPDPLVVDLLTLLEALQLDFHLFFRRLSTLRLADLADDAARLAKADLFFYRDGLPLDVTVSPKDARRRIADWLDQWRQRVLTHAVPEDDRIRAMKAVNPNFIPRGWILDEVIRRVERQGERDVLRRITHMALHPFADSWHGQAFDGQVYQGDPDEEVRWTQDVPARGRAMQCSCSS